VEIMTHLVRRRWPQRAVILLAAAALLFLCPPVQASAAAADDDLKWSVVPSSPTGPKGRKTFDYELSPKEKLTDWVGVANLSNRPLTIDLYATDAFNAIDGGFALLNSAQPARDVGTWITLPRKQVTIAANKRLDIPFTLTVPPGAEPGDHIGGVIGSVTEYALNAEGQRVKVERRIAARVYLRVAGPLRPDVAITTVAVDYHASALPFGRKMTVTYQIANHGNVRVTGTARVKVTGPLGIRLGNSELINIPELLPDSEIRLQETLGSVFPAGRLTASVTANTQTNKAGLPAATRSTSRLAVPWAIVGLLVLLLVFLAYRVIARRVRRRRASLLEAAGRPGLAAKPA
jgi:WxL Interacting Protein, peptidoglycan binding domain